jgi:hypothetical protein
VKQMVEHVSITATNEKPASVFINTQQEERLFYVDT